MDLINPFSLTATSRAELLDNPLDYLTAKNYFLEKNACHTNTIMVKLEWKNMENMENSGKLD